MLHRFSSKIDFEIKTIQVFPFSIFIFIEENSLIFFSRYFLNGRFSSEFAAYDTRPHSKCLQKIDIKFSGLSDSKFFEKFRKIVENFKNLNKTICYCIDHRKILQKTHWTFMTNFALNTQQICVTKTSGNPENWKIKFRRKLVNFIIFLK